jgi:hypothetical protein
MVEARHLGEQLGTAVHITEGSEGTGAAERDDIGHAAAVPHPLGLALDLAADPIRRRVRDPGKLGPGQAVQGQVALEDAGRLPP